MWKIFLDYWKEKMKTLRTLNKFDGIYPFGCYVKKIEDATFVEFKVTTPKKDYRYPFRCEPHWKESQMFDYMYKQAVSYFRSVIK